MLVLRACCVCVACARYHILKFLLFILFDFVIARPLPYVYRLGDSICPGSAKRVILFTLNKITLLVDPGFCTADWNERVGSALCLSAWSASREREIERRDDK